MEPHESDLTGKPVVLGYFVVLFDVQSLYTSITHNNGIEAINFGQKNIHEH